MTQVCIELQPFSYELDTLPPDHCTHCHLRKPLQTARVGSSLKARFSARNLIKNHKKITDSILIP